MADKGKRDDDGGGGVAISRRTLLLLGQGLTGAEQTGKLFVTVDLKACCCSYRRRHTRNPVTVHRLAWLSGGLCIVKSAASSRVVWLGKKLGAVEIR